MSLRFALVPLVLAGGLGAAPAGPASLPPARAALWEKMAEVKIPSVTLDRISLQDAVEWLRAQAAAADRQEKDPALRGITVVVVEPGAARDRDLSLQFAGGTLQEACEAVADAARRDLSVEPGAVTFSPSEASADRAARTADGFLDEENARIALRPESTSRSGAVSAGFLVSGQPAAAFGPSTRAPLRGPGSVSR